MAPCVVQLRALPLPRPKDLASVQDSAEDRCFLRSSLLAHYARIGVRPIVGDGSSDPTGVLPVWCQACVPDAQGFLPMPNPRG